MNPVFVVSYPVQFASLNDGAVKWLNGDEVLINFDKYCTLFRLAPFSSTSVDKWPHHASHLSISDNCLRSILHTFRDLQGLAKITVNDCRRDNASRDWKIIHDVFTDPLITADDNGSEFKLNSVSCCHERAAIFNVSDGQILLYVCDRGVWTFVENLTSKIIRYLIDHRQITNRLKLESKTEEPVATDSATVALYYLRASRLCSTKFWIWISTFEESKTNLCKYVISIQGDNSLIIWLNEKSFGNNDSTHILEIRMNYFAENISAAIFGGQRGDAGFLIVGSNEGNIYCAGVDSFNATKSNLAIEELSILITCNDHLRVNCLKLKSCGDGKYFLIAGRQSTVLVATLLVDGCKLTATDILPHLNGFHAFSHDCLMKFGFETIQNKLSLKQIPCDLVNEKEMEIFGMSSSLNDTFVSFCLRKRVLDKYDCKYPFSFNVFALKNADEVWQTLLSRDLLSHCGDLLTCLRESLLQPSLPQSVLGDIECSIANLNDIPTWQLKIIRHALHALKHRQENTDEQLAKWTSNFFNVERLLITSYARQIVERWKSSSANQRKFGYSLARSADLWLIGRDSQTKSVDGVDLGPQICSICGSALNIWSETKCLEKLCQNNHRIPLCCLTLMPLAEFSYRKCCRCNLLACDRQVQSEAVKILIPDQDLCPFCDGFLM